MEGILWKWKEFFKNGVSEDSQLWVPRFKILLSNNFKWEINFLMLIDIFIKPLYVLFISKYVLELEKEYLYIYNWIALLCTWNKHNIVSWLYSN